MRLTEISYSPLLQNSFHSHEYAYIGVTLEGNSTQVSGTSVRTSEPWTVMYHPLGEVHADKFHDRGARELNIEIAIAKFQKLWNYATFPDGPMLMQGGKAGWVAARLYAEFRLMDNLSPLAIEGLTIELIAAILRHKVDISPARELPWLGRVSDLIHARYTEKLTLCDLASAVGIHPVHVAREFHRRMGCTIGQRIRQLRIERACQLLAQGDSPLVDIALCTGFPDQSQFTKTFKNLVGITPSEYRRLKQAR
jgi:AraC family transcriptional regulator